MTNLHHAPHADDHQTRRRWSLTSFASFGLLLVTLLGWIGAGFLVDFTGLDQGEDSWGYLAAAILLLLMFAPLPMLLIGGLCLGGAVSGQPGWAWAAAIIQAVAAVAGVGAGLYLGATEPPAGQAFGAAVSLISLLLLVPLALCFRARRQSLRSRT